MSEKIAGCYYKDGSRQWNNQTLINSLHLGTMRTRLKCETDGMMSCMMSIVAQKWLHFTVES